MPESELSHLQDSILKLQNVSLSLNQGTQILNNLNIEVHRGEILSVIGPSGVGKTLLLKVMAGLIRLDSGTSLFEGQNLSELSLRSRRQYSKKIAMTFQRSGLFDSLNCEDNLHFPLSETSKLNLQEIEKRIFQALEDVGLEGQNKLFPHEMSGGMQKRLGIARALALRPELILYDDPTAGLDSLTSEAMSELILKTKKKYSMTLVVVTSNLKLAYALSDRMAFLYEGRFLEIGTVSEIRRSQNPVIYQFLRGLLEGPLTEKML